VQGAIRLQFVDSFGHVNGIHSFAIRVALKVAKTARRGFGRWG